MAISVFLQPNVPLCAEVRLIRSGDHPTVHITSTEVCLFVLEVEWAISLLVVAGSQDGVQGPKWVVGCGDDLWLPVDHGVALGAGRLEVDRGVERELHRAVVVPRQEPGVVNVM